MKAMLVSVALALAVVPSGAYASTALASCRASTPHVGANLEIDDAAACAASFSTTVAQVVTTRIEPDAAFAGWAGLRVRGVNALWTQYDGYFVGGTLVTGSGTSTFTLQPGSWQLEVYVSEPNSALTAAGHSGFGSYGGSVSA